MSRTLPCMPKMLIPDDVEIFYPVFLSSSDSSGSDSKSDEDEERPGLEDFFSDVSDDDPNDDPNDDDPHYRTAENKSPKKSLSSPTKISLKKTLGSQSPQKCFKKRVKKKIMRKSKKKGHNHKSAFKYGESRSLSLKRKLSENVFKKLSSFSCFSSPKVHDAANSTEVSKKIKLSDERKISEGRTWDQPSTSKASLNEQVDKMSSSEDSAVMSTDAFDNDIKIRPLPKKSERLRPGEISPVENVCAMSIEQQSYEEEKRLLRKTNKDDQHYQRNTTDDFSSMSVDDEPEDVKNQSLRNKSAELQPDQFSSLKNGSKKKPDNKKCAVPTEKISTNNSSKHSPRKKQKKGQGSQKESSEDSDYKNKITVLREMLAEALPDPKKCKSVQKISSKNTPMKSIPENKSPETDSDSRKDGNLNDNSAKPSGKEKSPKKKNHKSKKKYMSLRRRDLFYNRREMRLRRIYKKNYSRESSPEEICDVKKINRTRLLKNYFIKFSKPENPWRNRVLFWIKTVVKGLVLPKMELPRVCLSGMSPNDYFVVDNFDSLDLAAEICVPNEVVQESMDQSGSQSSENQSSGEQSDKDAKRILAEKRLADEIFGKDDYHFPDNFDGSSEVAPGMSASNEKVVQESSAQSSSDSSDGQRADSGITDYLSSHSSDS